MYLQHFGLKHDPLGKSEHELIDNPQSQQLLTHLNWLVSSKGIGVITGEAGIGKTTGVREWIKSLNPHIHRVIYQPDNHFHPFDIYSQFADSLGLQTHNRYSRLWRSLKRELLHLHEEKKVTPIWILDEAQQLPLNFFTELPAFLNFSFDTRDVLIIILIGGVKLHHTLQRSVCSALASRIQFHFEWKALEEFEQFQRFVNQAFQKAGCSQTLMSQSAFKLIHLASKGRLRFAHQIITRGLQLATDQNLNHLSDELVQLSVDQLRSIGAH
jgi:type II secretory pathway predicted ATPase ExeA